MFQIIFGGRIRASGPTNTTQTRNMGQATYVQALAGLQAFQLTTYGLSRYFTLDNLYRYHGGLYS